MTNAIRVAWLSTALLPRAVASAGDSSVGIWLVWGVWLLVAIAVLVPHPLALVMVRLVTPLLVLNGVAVLVHDSNPRWGAFLGPAIMLGVGVVGFTASYGAIHAQAAAYGHERRHLLRPPVAVIAPLTLLWMANLTLAATAIFADRLPVSMAAATLLVALGAFTLRRAMVLARRWLVFVPAGIAVHDPLFLRDTFMVRTHDVRALRAVDRSSVASNDSTDEAFDATGTTWGSPLELVLSHPHDVSLSSFGARLSRTLDRLHVKSVLVAPSRPRAALADAAR